MAKSLLIKAKPRENKKPNALRASGFVPGTVYGHGFESKAIQISAKEFSKIPHKAYSHINELEINEEKYPVLIRNVQIDPVKDFYLNIEFYRIKSDEKIKVKVSLNYVGHSPAVLAGGVLIVSFNEIEIQCLPTDIPDAIDVSLEQIIEIGQAIHARDLKVPETIHILAKPDEVLAHVEIPKTHIVEEEAPTPVAGAIPAEGVAPAAEGAAATPTAAKEAAPAPGGKQAAAGGKQVSAPAAKAPEVKPPKK